MGIPLWLPSIRAKNEQRLWGRGCGWRGRQGSQRGGLLGEQGAAGRKGALGMGLEPALQALGVSLEEGLGVGERLARSGLCDTWVASGGAGGGGGIVRMAWRVRGASIDQ